MSKRLKLGTSECSNELASLWLEMMKRIKKPRGRKVWRLPRPSDSPIGVGEPLENLRSRMWGDGIPKTITVGDRELMPVDRVASRVTR